MRMEKGLDGSVAVGADNPTVRRGWEAHLRLGFSSVDGKTLLSHRCHRGPLVVQRPFYPEDGVCHVYLLHPPGGVVAGDRLEIDLVVGKEGRALLTTPAAGKFYRSAGDVARQSVVIRVEPDAALEWLPQETIVYEGAHLISDMKIDLDAAARFIGWEVHAFGRLASGEGFNSGKAVLNWRIDRMGKPFYVERMQLDADAFSARWGLNGHSSCGTLIAYPVSTPALAKVRKWIEDKESLGVSCIENLLICRGLDSKADRLRQYFQQLWAALRYEIVGCEAKTPRIWAT